MTTIILVDDDADVRYAVGELLRETGYAVCEAASGEQALAVLQSGPADLVLTDIYMPGIDGIDLILQARAHDPALKIIAFSGGGMRQDPKVATALATMNGADHVMQKPVDNEQLLAAVAKLTAG